MDSLNSSATSGVVIPAINGMILDVIWIVKKYKEKIDHND